MRILLIDDDAVFSNAPSEILEDQNIQVDQAECGETGIELADIYDYRAIVLDFGLPDMTGSVVLNELGKNGDQTPAVILSGQTEIEARLTCLRRGRVVSKETFLDHLYGGIDEPEMKIIDVFICKLRKKIGRETHDTALIETVWGRGYRVNAEAVA